MTDGERARALEARIVDLELRLGRLETAAGAVPPPTPSPPRSAHAPPPAAGPTSSPAGHTVLSTSAPASGWVVPEPRSRSVGAPDASPPGPSAGSPPRPPRPIAATLRDLEARITGRALAWVGGIALVLGVIFLTSLAFTRGWIGHELRVLIGVVVGAIAVALGALSMERRNRLLGHVLTPVGLAMITIGLVGATRLYDLVPVGVGLLVALACAAAVALIAVRAEAPVVAGFGLIGVLIAPPLLDAPPDASTLAYVAVILVASAAVALWRSWRWLPSIAFLLAAPQVAVWIVHDPAASLALAGLAGFWLVNVVAAGGEAVRRGRDDLSVSSVTLLLANVAFLVGAGFVVLNGDLTPHRGVFLVVVAVAHIAVGGTFVMRRGDRHLFGLLNLGTGIAAISMAIPIQLGADVVPVAWTAEAVALAALAGWRRHPYSAIVSGILYVLAGAYLIVLFDGPAPAAPFAAMVDARGAALAFFLAGIGAGVGIVRDIGIRSLLVAFGSVVAAACAWVGAEPPAAVIGMTLVSVVGVCAWRVLPRRAEHAIDWRGEGLFPAGVGTAAEWRELFTATLPWALAAVGTALALTVVRAFYGPSSTPADALPFVHPAGAALAFALLGVLAVAFILPVARARDLLLAIGIQVVAVICPAELDGAPLVIAFVALSGIAAAASMAPGATTRVYLVPAAWLALAAAAYLIVVAAPPGLLVVRNAPVVASEALPQLAAIAAVAVALAILARAGGRSPRARWAWLGAGLALLYLPSIAVVMAVGSQVSESVPFAERRTQGQVALSVLWAVLGALALVGGLGSRRVALRQVGLAVLALATVKVFLFDLASLEVAYRVISLIALGLVLLVSAWLWQRLQAGAADASPTTGAPPTTGAGRADPPPTSDEPLPASPDGAPTPPTVNDTP